MIYIFEAIKILIVLVYFLFLRRFILSDKSIKEVKMNIEEKTPITATRLSFTRGLSKSIKNVKDQHTN